MCTCTSSHVYELGHRHSSLFSRVSSFMLPCTDSCPPMLGLNPGYTDRLLRERGKVCVYELVWQIGRGIPPLFSYLPVVYAFLYFSFLYYFPNTVMFSSSVQQNSHSDVVWMISMELHWYGHSSYFDLLFCPEIVSFVMFLRCDANSPWYFSWQPNHKF